MLKCNLFKNKLILKIMILRNHKRIYNKNVIIQSKPFIRYYFLSKKEKQDKIKAFNNIITNFKNQ
tara:strand:- start:696 stop:890 length:195 start_codon:yes stop_codon:yes gene_type:complete